MANESEVQLAPDGTGKQVRTILAQTLINGVPTTVQMQVISIADAFGNVIPLDINAKLDETNTLLRALLEVLCESEEVAPEDMVAIAKQRALTTGATEG